MKGLKNKNKNSESVGKFGEWVYFKREIYLFGINIKGKSIIHIWCSELYPIVNQNSYFSFRNLEIDILTNLSGLVDKDRVKCEHLAYFMWKTIKFYNLRTFGPFLANRGIIQ